MKGTKMGSEDRWVPQRPREANVVMGSILWACCNWVHGQVLGC